MVQLVIGEKKWGPWMDAFRSWLTAEKAADLSERIKTISEEVPALAGVFA